MKTIITALALFLSLSSISHAQLGVRGGDGPGNIELCGAAMSQDYESQLLIGEWFLSCCSNGIISDGCDQSWMACGDRKNLLSRCK